MEPRSTINEAEIDEALDYLRENAVAAAQARANRLYLDEFKKSLHARLMQECEKRFIPTKPGEKMAISAQERDAYAHPEYVAHLDAMKDAIYEDEKHRFLLAAAEAKIEAWRTMQANERATSRMV